MPVIASPMFCEGCESSGLWRRSKCVWLQFPMQSALKNTAVLSAIVLAAAVLSLCSACNRLPPDSAATSQPARKNSEVGTSSISTPTLRCPTMGLARVQPPPLAKSGHRVTLSWKPSAPASSRHDAAVGYCIYRSVKRKDPSPELVNAIPFAGTTCMDDWVENEAKYYYVVKAINAKGRTSINSNEVIAAIPAGNQVPAPSSGVPAPLCRGPEK